MHKKHRVRLPNLYSATKYKPTPPMKRVNLQIIKLGLLIFQYVKVKMHIFTGFQGKGNIKLMREGEYQT